MEIKKSYFAVIPATVRYDKTIPAAAKLLYGEITALCNQSGLCWAENTYFANLYEVSVRTVQFWINALLNAGYIHRNIQYAEDGKTGDYTVTYQNNQTIGTATATITAVEGSAYAGSKNVTYKIVGQKLSKAAVDGITAKTYTGSEADVLQNNVKLTLDHKVLQESKDHGITDRKSVV